MNNLTYQLKNLKKLVKPDQTWKEKAYQEIISFAKTHPLKKEKEIYSYSLLFSKPLYRVALALLCLLLFVAVPFSVVAAKTSRPGQLFYPIKRILEEGEIFLTKSQEEKNNLQYKLVEKRVEELEKSILFDSEENQTTAVEETKRSIKKVLELSGENQKQVSYIKEALIEIEPKTSSSYVAKKIKALVSSLQEEQNLIKPINPGKTPTPTIKKSIPITYPSSSPTMTQTATATPIQQSKDIESSPSPSPIPPTPTKQAAVTKIPVKVETKAVEVKILP